MNVVIDGLEAQRLAIMLEFMSGDQDSQRLDPSRIATGALDAVSRPFDRGLLGLAAEGVPIAAPTRG